MRLLLPCWGVVLLFALPGCAGETFGGLLYHFGLLGTPRVAARFDLASGPLLILVDDDLGLLTWAPARDLLTDEIGKRLREARANAQAVPSQTVNAMRRADPQFQERSISELGKKSAARQVLWLQIREFVATKDIDTVSDAARCRVRVKVFDPHAENRADMRLWPADRAGEIVVAAKSAAELVRLETDEDIARTVIVEMADKIAKLFYKHREEV